MLPDKAQWCSSLVIGAEARFTHSYQEQLAFEQFGYELDPLPAPVTASTDSEGCVAVQLPAHPMLRWTLEVTRPGLASVARDLDELAPGLPLRLGRFTARPASTLVVQIVQPDGSPAADAISASVKITSRGPFGEKNSRYIFRAAEAGVVVFDDLVV